MATTSAEFTTYRRVRNGKEQIVTRRRRADERGWARTALYKVWTGMRYRCRDPKAQNYRWYGGRGIAVCSEWEHDFAAFRDWSRANGYEPGMELDREDNDGPYAPDNCRWVTRLVNMQNRAAYLPRDIEDALRAEADRRKVGVYTVIREAVEEHLGLSDGRR